VLSTTHSVTGNSTKRVPSQLAHPHNVSILRGTFISAKVARKFFNNEVWRSKTRKKASDGANARHYWNSKNCWDNKKRTII